MATKEQLKTLHGLEGKVIKYVGEDLDSEMVLLAFEDNTYVVLRAEVQYEDSAMLVVDDRKIVPSEWSDGALVDSGLYNPDRLVQIKKEKQEEDLRRQENSERHQYEKLKAKFESS